MSHCPDSARLSKYALGTLPEDESLLVARHLDTCAKCEATIAALDDQADAVVAALREAKEEYLYEAEPEYQRTVEHLRATVQAREHPDSPRTDGDIPREIGRYRLLEKLGAGGMGVVFQAIHIDLERTVALKVLPLNRIPGRRRIARFRQEMRALGKLQHPNIVAALDAGEAQGVYFLVMEYIDGVTLSALLATHGPLDVADACELVRQAATGLQFAHEHGLVHRDIKPSNIMLSRDGQIKILDLGLALLSAAEVDDEEATGPPEIVGTIEYMAPEQVADSRAVDIRTDIFGLGCTLYKLLAGRTAFPAAAPGAEGPTPSPPCVAEAPVPIERYRPEVPVELVAVLNRMLARNPAERFAEPAEVAAAIGPFCAGSNLRELVNGTSQTVPEKDAAEGSPIVGKDKPGAAPAAPPHPRAIACSGRNPFLRHWKAVAGVAAMTMLAGVAPFLVRSLLRVHDRPRLDTALFSAPNMKLPPTVRAESRDAWVLAEGQAGPHPNDGGNAVAVDREGNVYVTGSIYFEGSSGTNPGPADIFIAKYRASGVEAWKHQLGSPRGDDRGNSIAVDNAGNVYVTGHFQGEADFDAGEGAVRRASDGGTMDVFVIKLDPAGHTLWVDTFGQSTDTWDRGTGIAVDNAGHVYVTGEFGAAVDFDPDPEKTLVLNSAGAGDVFVLKLSDTGELGSDGWARSVGAAKRDTANGLAWDGAGGCYIAGTLQPANANESAGGDRNAFEHDAFVLKLDGSGNRLWVRHFSGRGFDQATSVAADSRAVCVLLQFENDLDLDEDGAADFESCGLFDVCVARLDPRGTLVWARSIGNGGSDFARTVALGQTGEVFVAGQFSDRVDFDPGPNVRDLVAAGASDGFLWKLDAEGQLAWAYRLGGPQEDAARAIQVDPAGNVVATGFFEGPAEFPAAAGTMRLAGEAARGRDMFVVRFAQW
jgi:hypothetical protein